MSEIRRVANRSQTDTGMTTRKRLRDVREVGDEDGTEAGTSADFMHMRAKVVGVYECIL